MTPEAGRPIQPDRGETLLSRLISDYGILLALLLLCIYFSISTVSVEALSGRDGGRILGVSVRSRFTDREVLVVAGNSPQDREFANALIKELEMGQLEFRQVRGEPADARKALEKIAREG